MFSVANDRVSVLLFDVCGCTRPMVAVLSYLCAFIVSFRNDAC